jgi:hypothetical protein
LSQDLISSGWIIPTGCPRVNRLKERHIHEYLKKPTVGPILQRILEDGANLIRRSPYDVDNLTDDQLRVRPVVIMEALEDAMVTDGCWVSAGRVPVQCRSADILRPILRWSKPKATGSSGYELGRCIAPIPIYVASVYTTSC